MPRRCVRISRLRRADSRHARKGRARSSRRHRALTFSNLYLALTFSNLYVVHAKNASALNARRRRSKRTSARLASRAPRLASAATRAHRRNAPRVVVLPAAASAERILARAVFAFVARSNHRSNAVDSLTARMRRTTRRAAVRIRATSATCARHRATHLAAAEFNHRRAHRSSNSPPAADFLAIRRQRTKPSVHRRQCHRARHWRTLRHIRSWFRRLARSSEVRRSHAVTSRCRHFFS